MREERLKIAVFVDFDNIEIGVKTTLGVAFDVGTILEAIKERGEVVTKIAYGDWTRAGDYSRLLTQHAIKMVQRNLTPGGDKNGADINLALDALEMALTHDHIDAYVIVGGDSDFLSLVEKLKQYDKMVFVVGGRAFTSVILQRNCHEFIAYENLIGQPARRQPERGGKLTQASQPVSQALPLVRRALKVLSEREVTPQLGLLKSTLLQLDSTFSEKNYGAGSFRDFAEKLEQAGLLRINRSGRNLLVESAEGEPEDEAPQADERPREAEAERDHDHRDRRRGADRAEREHGEGDRHERERRHERDRERPAGQAAPAPHPREAEPEGREREGAMAPGEALAIQQAEAVNLLRRVIENAATPPRWPMYVRNVKQLLRAAEAGFDERRYGFGGILDLLRGAQRDMVLRLERDRQGVLRVFPGPVLQRAAAGAAIGVPVDAEEIAPSSTEGVEMAPSQPDEEPGIEAAPEPAVEAEPVDQPAAEGEGEALAPAIVDAEPIEPVETPEAPVEVIDAGEGSEAAAPREGRPRRRRTTGTRKTAGTARKPRAAAATASPRTRARRPRETKPKE